MGPTILSYSMSVGSPARVYQFGQVMCSIVYLMKMVGGVHSRPEHSFWYAGGHTGSIIQGPGKIRSPRHCNITTPCY